MNDCLMITGVEIRRGNWAVLGTENKAELSAHQAVTTTQDIYRLLSSRQELMEDRRNSEPLPVRYCSTCYSPLVGEDTPTQCRRCFNKKMGIDNTGEGGL